MGFPAWILKVTPKNGNGLLPGFLFHSPFFLERLSLQVKQPGRWESEHDGRWVFIVGIRYMFEAHVSWNHEWILGFFNQTTNPIFFPSTFRRWIPFLKTTENCWVSKFPFWPPLRPSTKSYKITMNIKGPRNDMSQSIKLPNQCLSRHSALRWQSRQRWAKPLAAVVPRLMDCNWRFTRPSWNSLLEDGWKTGRLTEGPNEQRAFKIPRPSKGVKVQPPGLFLVVDGVKPSDPWKILQVQLCSIMKVGLAENDWRMMMMMMMMMLMLVVIIKVNMKN